MNPNYGAWVPNPLNSQVLQEATLKSLDPSRICRVCLLSGSQCGLFSINSISKTLLSDMFDIQIDKEAVSMICVPCLQSIETAAQFKEMAKSSDWRFRTEAQRAFKVELEECTAEPEPAVINTPILEFETEDQTLANEQIEDIDEVKNESAAEMSATVPQEPAKLVRSRSNAKKKKISCPTPSCKRSFRRQYDLLRHLKKMHPKWRSTSLSKEAPSSPQPSTSAESESPVPQVSLPVILKEIRVVLKRCDQDQSVEVKRERLSPVATAETPAEKEVSCPYCDILVGVSIFLKHLDDAHGTPQSVSQNSVKIKDEPPDPSEMDIEPAEGPCHECHVCQAKFELLSELIKHRETTHQSAGAAPPQRRAAISANKNLFEGGFVFNCVHCSKKFGTKRMLTEHLRIVHSYSDPSRKRTPEGEGTKWEPDNDVSIIDGMIRCNICSKMYSSKTSFWRHTTRTHPEKKTASDKKYRCWDCGFKFENHSKLLKHKRHDCERRLRP